jgi:hypothetical protein
MILNARATVLLNVSFRNLSQPMHIIKLSELALALWISRQTETDWGYGMFDRGSEAEESAWVAQRMIQLVRDDIYQLFCNAVDESADADRVDQQTKPGCKRSRPSYRVQGLLPCSYGTFETSLRT